MAAIRGGRGRGRAFLAEGEAPDAHVAEEGRRVIRGLVARQTGAVATLEQQQAREREREFRRAAAVLPLGDVSSGAASLQDFAARAERASRIEELAATGLPLDDLRLLLAHEEAEEAGTSAERVTEPERLAREERLRELQRRLDARASTSSSLETPHGEDSGGKPGPSRHVQELGASLRPAGGALSPFVRLALDKQSPAAASGAADGEPPHFRDAAAPAPRHPVHRLAAMERGMFGHLDVDAGPAPPSATSRKRRRQRQAVDRQRTVRDADGGCGGGTAVVGGRAGSLWDVRDAGQQQQQARRVPVKQTPGAAGRPHGPARPKQYTVRDGSIVELRAADADKEGDEDEGEAADGGCGGGGGGGTKRSSKGAVFVPTGSGALTREELQSNRLTLEEIKRQPRFAAYEEGTPSTVLFVKNLDGAVTEDDMAAVFGCFQTPGAPSVSFRLCGGRMRGQAFVTFSAQEDAAAALAGTNGYLLRGRPLIVQYGRGRSS